MTMTRDAVIALLRADEAVALAQLPVPSPDVQKASTLMPVSRELYAAVERPPTRHRQFVIRTFWHREGLVPSSHAVFVKDGRSWRRIRQVVEDRPGAFGA